MKWYVAMLADVVEARLRIAPYPCPTPRYRFATVNDLLDAEDSVKHENRQLVGACKVPGRINLIWQLSADECHRGVIAASTGNHGQSIACVAACSGCRRSSAHASAAVRSSP